jgi:hypothetical protein
VAARSSWTAALTSASASASDQAGLGSPFLTWKQSFSFDYVTGRIGTRLYQGDVKPAEPLNLLKECGLIVAASPQCIRTTLDKKVVVGRLAG